MNQLIKNLAFVCLILIQACSSTTTKEPATDNIELQQLKNEDQADRMSRPIDWSIVSVNDENRRVRVLEFLDSGLISTATDYSNAAMIFQHGMDTIDSKMAVDMMQKAVNLDTTINKWLLAAAIDRDLMRRGEPQIYGTQFIKRNSDQPWEQYELDSTAISDTERKDYKVETLAEQRVKLILMNKKKLLNFLENGGTIQEISAWNDPSLIESYEYDLSESSLNSLGYSLMRENRLNDAEVIFKLNTVLYPSAFNTFDSYGECLMKINKKEEAITAYKKSLELNPGNENAKKVLKELI